MSTRRLFKNSVVTSMAKVLNALIQIICLPVLLEVFGQENYGLIVIAMSLNTFIAIIQFSLPTGIPKFVAEWLAKHEHAQLNAAMRTVSSFYVAIATINALLLSGLALLWPDLFQVNPNQIVTLQVLLMITAATSFLAIPATALDQMLTGAHELGFVSSLEIIKNLFFAGLVAFVYYIPETLSITQFYALRCSLMFLMVPAKVWMWTKYGKLGVFIPGWNLKAVLPLLKYCVSLMTFSVFLMLSSSLCPVIMGIRVPSNAGAVMTDYHIINCVRIFFVMLASSFMMVLVPHLSGLVARGDDEILAKTILHGTKIVWGFGALLGFGVIMLSREALSVYVGEQYMYLQKWLVILTIASLYDLYNPAMSAVILSLGKLRPLIFATGLGCLLSLSICWLLSPSLGVGSIAWSFIASNLARFLVVHFWYFPKYFGLNPVNHILNVLFPPVVAGIAMCIAGRWIIDRIGHTNDLINIAIGVVCGTIIYTLIIGTIYIRPNQAWKLVVKLRNG